MAKYNTGSKPDSKNQSELAETHIKGMRWNKEGNILTVTTVKLEPPRQYRLEIDHNDQIKKIQERKHKKGEWTEYTHIRSPESNLSNMIKEAIERLLNTTPWVDVVNFEKVSNPHQY